MLLLLLLMLLMLLLLLLLLHLLLMRLLPLLRPLLLLGDDLRPRRPVCRDHGCARELECSHAESFCAPGRGREARWVPDGPEIADKSHIECKRVWLRHLLCLNMLYGTPPPLGVENSWVAC